MIFEILQKLPLIFIKIKLMIKCFIDKCIIYHIAYNIFDWRNEMKFRLHIVQTIFTSIRAQIIRVK